MTPNLGRKANAASAQSAALPVKSGEMPAQAAEMIRALARMQSEALRNSRWVGKDFAEQSRAIHYGERDAETIHGEASVDEAKALIDEGIAVAPLPFPVAPPDKTN